MNSCVVIVRLINNPTDIIAILNGELDGKIRLEHPYFIKFDSAHSTVGMVPYCALSEEQYYQIDCSRIDFVVTANPDISQKFIAMVDGSSLSTDSTSDDLSPRDHLSFVAGNDTRH